MSLRYCILSFVTGLLAAFGSAQTWYVNPEGSSEQTGSPEQPFATLQQALDAVGDGEVIVLTPGVYTGAGNYDLHSSGISLTIRSTDPNDWGVVASTVIDANGAGGIFEFTDGEGLITVEGLTFQNALKLIPEDPHNPPDPLEPPYYTIPHGPAIMCLDTDIAVVNCIFQACQTNGLGGAVYVNNSNASVSHSIFAGNQSWYGGAVMSDEGSVVQLDHCTIAGNVGVFGGGGVSGEFGSSLAINNSILWGNRLSESGEQGRQILAQLGSVVTIDYSVVEDGAEGIFSDTTSSIFLGDGILDDAPLFADFDSETSPLTWDLRLKSIFGRWDAGIQEWVTDTEISPCIAAGSEEADYSREPWPNGRRVNLGAYGNTGQASLFGNIADLNVDGRVDLADLAALAAVWQDAPSDYEDFDGSGLVELTDLSVMADNWLWTMPSF